MRWVDIPYEIVGDTMHTQRTEWPRCCACCGGDTDGRLDTGHGPGGVEKGFSVGFAVPLCGECGAHAGRVLPIRMAVGVAVFGLWVLVGWLLFLNDMAYDAIGMVLFLASAVLLGCAGFRISRLLVALLSEAKMKDGCVGADYAVAVEPFAGRWRLEFRRDEYAEAFAAYHGLVMPPSSQWLPQ